MAESITIKALQDASLDAKSLEEVVNGSETKQVTTRLGENYPSVKKAIKTLFENGGLPATPFETKALMESSELTDGAYAMVTDDTVNNGLYVKTAGAWVKSGYDPLTQAETYTDARVARIDAELTGITAHPFDETLTTVTGVDHTILQGVPVLAGAEITSVSIRSGNVRDISIVIADKQQNGSFTKAKEIPVTVSTGVNHFDVAISVEAGQYIGVSGPINLGSDTSIKNQPYIRFNSTLTTSPQVPYTTLSDAQIALSYSTASITEAVKATSGLVDRVSGLEAEINGKAYHPFDESKATTASTHPALLLATPIQTNGVISKISYRSGGTPREFRVVVADKNLDGTFEVSEEVGPFTSAQGTNTLDVFIRVEEGQYIGVNGNVSIGTDTSVKNQQYMRFESEISETPQLPRLTNADAQIALGYSTVDFLDELEKLKDGAPVTIGQGAKLKKDTDADSSHTPNPLFIADTFGTNQPLHPTVEYFEEGFNGYKYVMVQTPYPRSGLPLYKDRYECPTLHYSLDGISWTAGQLIDDLTADEIVNKDYFSDPELLWNPDLEQLELWYRISRGHDGTDTDILRRIINPDGTISERETLISASQILGVTRILSPSLLYEDGKYKMWHTGRIGGNVGYAETTDPTDFDSWSWSSVSLGSGATNCWHLDVVRVDGTYYLFNNTVPFDLQLYTATEPTSFTKQGDILTKTGDSKDFYGGVIYRSSGLVVQGRFLLYVSGWTSGTPAYASIGLMEGDSFENLSLIDGGYKRNDLRIGGNIRLSNTEFLSSMIELDDRGSSLGFDYETGTLFFQRHTGERIKIAQ